MKFSQKFKKKKVEILGFLLLPDLKLQHTIFLSLVTGSETISNKFQTIFPKTKEVIPRKIMANFNLFNLKKSKKCYFT